MKKKAYTYLFFMIVFYSCASNQTIAEQKLLTTPDQSSNAQACKTFFELESIVPIETSEDYLISYLDRVISYKDKIILLTRNDKSIFVINTHTGKVETHIKRIGTGPGESNIIIDIAFDDQLENIIVLNDYYKLLFFSLSGDFLEEEKINKNVLYENIVYSEGNIIFYNVLNGYSCHPYSINIYNLRDKTWKKEGNDEEIKFGIRNNGKQIVKSKNIWFTAPLDFSLYTLIDGEIESPYQLDLSTKTMNEHLIKKSTTDPTTFFNTVASNNIIYGINSIRETNNFFVLKSNLPGYFIINKSTFEVQWEKSWEDEYTGVKLSNYYPHDNDDNRIMFVVKPQEWMKRDVKKNENIPSFWKEKINSINMEEDSNPILFFYREKEIK